MFLTMDDTSRVASWGLELGKSNKKFIEISDFLEVFKQVLRQNKYKNIQERVKRPNEGKELLLNHKVDLPFDERKIHIRNEYTSNLIRDFEIDKGFIEEYFFDEKAYKQSKYIRDIAKGER